VQYLVGLGANVNHATRERNTPFCIALVNENIEIARILATHGADVNVPNVRPVLYCAHRVCQPIYPNAHCNSFAKMTCSVVPDANRRDSLTYGDGVELARMHYLRVAALPTPQRRAWSWRQRSELRQFTDGCG
jgi:hypothetical protein